MRNTVKPLLLAATGAGMLVGLPLLGVQMAGRPLPPYLEFPPRTHYVAHAGFSWPVFIGLAILIAAGVAPFVLRAAGFRVQGPGGDRPPPRLAGSDVSSPLIRQAPGAGRPFPLWGWLGILAGIISWVLAWARFPWFAPLQPFTFSPLWFSYIVVINALTYRRAGRCMMLDRPGRFLWLFPVSAGFWWFFEYLNRFVQNWYYEGIGDLTAWQYFVYATLPFSTVLPAVLGTREWLGTFPRLTSGLDCFAPIRLRHAERLAVAVLILSVAGLTWIGVLPDYLFPLLWVAPLAIILSMQALAGRPTLLAPLASGDWRNVFLLALSALICGFFWEMWNYRSLAQWIYAVPFVNRFHIFEMPILGYSGYLPFGLECAVIGSMAMRERN